ncbi:MAG: 2-oxo acid dehydrogenase subunit E2 [Treponema sp.]|jgi:pyruvate dehydrogenase E2 component (dihydrolipoamide acetyltransferase)|nr:2-oxo acid dehydrogenase subunit E2 [Treponema sp.]
MADSIIMPKTGMAMEEGSILEWRVKQGDEVKKGDVVALIETDKSTMELESDYDGVILAILYHPGDIVPVTRVMAWIGKAGEAVPAAPGSPVEAQAVTVPGKAAEENRPGGRPRMSPAARALAKAGGVAPDSLVPGGRYGEITRADVEAVLPAATPLARRIAEREGISLSGVTGSGFGGKIFSADLAARHAAGDADTRIPLTGIQKITGKRMLESRLTIPEVTENTRVDVTAMLSVREELNAGLASHGVSAKITVNDFVLTAAARALAAHPRMNAVLEGEELVYRGAVNLGVAVATDRGLLVPVIRRAQCMGLREISAAAAAAAAKARQGKLSPEEMSGGTFTVSNVGMFGITSFTPIINPPEAGILGVCAIEDELKLDGEKVVNRKKMGLSLAFDHRIIDGAESALFLKNVKELLEAPLLIIA